MLAFDIVIGATVLYSVVLSIDLFVPIGTLRLISSSGGGFSPKGCRRDTSDAPFLINAGYAVGMDVPGRN